MKKCKCVKECSFYLIDDSFDKNSKIEGGLYSYKESEIYDFYIEETAFGLCYDVKYNDSKTIGFPEDKFNTCFIEIKKED